jgi:hypothetical protein
MPVERWPAEPLRHRQRRGGLTMGTFDTTRPPIHEYLTGRTHRTT